MSDNETPFYLPFVKKEQLTKDTYTFYFKRTGEERDFIPGQYFEIKLDIKDADERGNSRVFTISSSPTDLEYFTITTRIIQSSFKMALNNLEPGALVHFDGPWNDLNFDERDSSPHVFLAGGIGVTPYHSIVKYTEDKNITTPMILLVSWKNLDEIVFDDFFRDAQEKLPNFTYVATLTEEDEMSADVWDGEKGRINEDMIKKYVTDIHNSKYFFAGPPAMVKALKETVEHMGVAKEKIIAEEFEGY